MPNELLQYDATHITGISIAVISLVISGLLIKRFTRKYEQVEIFWIPFLLVIGFVFGNKFI